MTVARDSTGQEIARLIEDEKWAEARAILLRELRRRPDDHWLLDRLSETHYEEGKIDLARPLIERAYAMNPECPLVLWDYAGTLEEVGETAHALRLYKRLLGRGLEEVAFGECGEGMRWAISLLADCTYRVAVCHLRLHKPLDALKWLQRYFAMRDEGAESIYTYDDLRNDFPASREVTRLKAIASTGPQRAAGITGYSVITATGDRVNDRLRPLKRRHKSGKSSRTLYVQPCEPATA
jgi:tetratricopeptide (TPR) repeat protein